MNKKKQKLPPFYEYYLIYTRGLGADLIQHTIENKKCIFPICERSSDDNYYKGFSEGYWLEEEYLFYE